MRLKWLFYISLLLILISASELPAQTGYFDFTNYAGSTSTLGMGEEGVALRNGQDAFTFNPANLTFSDKISLSLFHDPFPFQILGSSPINNFTAAFRLKGIGSFGLQYLIHDFGKVYSTTEESPDILMAEHYYDYAFALGYAGEISDELSMGVVIKYGQHNWGSTLRKGSLLFSGGLSYQPQIFARRVNLGLSLMNMGAPVEIKEPYVNPDDRGKIIWLNMDEPVSSMIHLAVSATPIETDYLSAKMQIGFGKYLINDGSDDSKSSFSALFNDWKDFPQDARLSEGMSFEWKPLDLGKGFSYYQKFYLGTISPGPKLARYNYFTHGAEIGIGYKEFAFSAGYSGKWHIVQGYSYYFLPEFPWETFQFSLEWDINKHFNLESESKAPAALKNILVSFASGYNFRKGRLIPPELDQYNKSRNSLSYTFEAAFYMNSKNALIAALYYTPITIAIPIWFDSASDFAKHTLEYKYETFGIYSAYRYHPLNVLPALYVQGGPGIVRINPVKPSYPKYRYQTSLNMAAGANLDMLNNNIIITPELNYQLMLVPIIASKAPRLGGENQIALALKAGYRF